VYDLALPLGRPYMYDSGCRLLVMIGYCLLVGLTCMFFIASYVWMCLGEKLEREEGESTQKLTKIFFIFFFEK